jgi:ComF family protein
MSPEPAPTTGLADLCGSCIGRERRFGRTVAAFAYQEPLSTLIAGFKYRAGLPQGQVLGELLLHELQHRYAGTTLPDLLVPVPLHHTRLRERGFNQALVLARRLGAALHIPVAAQALARTRSTPAQQGLSASQRKQNLRGSFALHANLDAYGTIALVDDVVTTMSTMHEIARVLWRAYPHVELHVWCIGRA